MLGFALIQPRPVALLPPPMERRISSLWIVMEYLEGGSLQDLIKMSPDNLDEPTTQWILREMLKVRGGLYPCPPPPCYAMLCYENEGAWTCEHGSFPYIVPCLLR